MSVAEKINIIKQKINNNINAVKTRHTYSGNSIDVSSDILNITGKPLGQCLTYLRKPTTLTTNMPYNPSNPQTMGIDIPTENTVIGNGDGKVKYILSISSLSIPELDVHIDNTKIGTIKFYPPNGESWTYQLYFGGALGNTIKIGTTSLVPPQTFYGLTCSGFSYGDFTPKSNCVMEVIIDIKVNNSSTERKNIEFNRILVRYINP